MKDNIEEIVQQISSRPSDMLAMGRTMMACQRTFLSYISTAVGFLGGGIGIILYLENIILIVIGCLLVIASIVILVVGYNDYRNMRKIISGAYTNLKSPQKPLDNRPKHEE